MLRTEVSRIEKYGEWDSEAMTTLPSLKTSRIITFLPTSQ
jgi:hypothetical protein